eukprot:g82296.t1
METSSSTHLDDLSREETVYLYKLATVVSKFVEPLRKKSSSFGFIRKEIQSLESFLKLFEEIAELHQSIAEAVKGGSDIISVLAKHVDKLQLYIPFTIEFHLCLAVFHTKYSKSWRFRSAVVKLRTETKVDVIETFHACSHRLATYEEQLRILEQEDAQQLLKQMATYIQQQKEKTSPEHISLIEVHKTIQGSPFKHVVQPHRKFIRQGEFVTPKDENVWYALYNDMLIWTDKSRHYKGHVKLNTLALIEEDVGMLLKGVKSFYYVALAPDGQEGKAVFTFYSNDHKEMEQIKQQVDEACDWSRKNVNPDRRESMVASGKSSLQGSGRGISSLRDIWKTKKGGSSEGSTSGSLQSTSSPQRVLETPGQESPASTTRLNRAAAMATISGTVDTAEVISSASPSSTHRSQTSPVPANHAKRTSNDSRGSNALSVSRASSQPPQPSPHSALKSSSGITVEQVPVKLGIDALVTAKYIPCQVLDRLVLLDDQFSASGGVASEEATDLLPNPETGESSTLLGAAVMIADISGFTKLNESMRQKMGDKGAETVSLHVNNYFSQILSICNKHGGDCVKFAGDALIVLFAREALEGRTDSGASRKGWFQTPSALSVRPSAGERPSHSLNNPPSTSIPNASPHSVKGSPSPHFFQNSKTSEANTEELVAMGLDPSVPVLARDPLRAAQAALELQSEAKVYQVSEEVSLTLHIALGVGPVYAWHVGGYDNEWEFLISGPPFNQLSNGLDLAAHGEVVCSKACWKLIHKYCKGFPLPKEKTKGEEVRLTSIEKPLVPHPVSKLPKVARNVECFNVGMRAYVSRCVLDKIDVKQGEYLSELRKVTVCFVNLSGLDMDKGGSGGWGSRRQEYNALSQLHFICGSLQAIICRNQGYRRQFLVDDKGTVLIVVFGVPPYAHEDDAYRALKTALEIRELLEEAGVKHAIGLATGEVYVGSVGSSERREHAVVGDTVNLSARLAGKAKKLEENNVLVDSATYEAVRNQVSLKAAGEINVKGKEEMIPIFIPASFDLATFDKSATTSATQTFGRDAEKKRFADGLDVCMQLMAGGKILLLQGPAGMGKTQLSKDFFALARAQRSSGLVRSLYYTVHPSQQKSLLALWRALLLELAELSDNADSSTLQTSSSVKRTVRKKREKEVAQRNKQVKGLIRMMNPKGTPDGRVPLLNLLLGTTFPDSTLTTKIAEDEPAIITYLTLLILDLVQGYMTAKKCALVLVLDDAHLLDADSLQVLKQLCNQTRTQPLFVILTARPASSSDKLTGTLWVEVEAMLRSWKADATEEDEEEDDAGVNHGDSNSEVVIDLKGLDQKSLEALVSRQLGVNKVPPAVMLAVSQKSEGNPLYAHEVAGHMLSAGVVTVDEKRNITVDEAKLNTIDLLPSSFQALITMRIDRLPLQQTLVCKLASAFGDEPVDLRLLRRLYIKEAETLEPAPTTENTAAAESSNEKKDTARNSENVFNIKIMRLGSRLVGKMKAAKERVNQRILRDRLDDNLLSLVRQGILGVNSYTLEQHLESDPESAVGDQSEPSITPPEPSTTISPTSGSTSSLLTEEKASGEKDDQDVADENRSKEDEKEEDSAKSFHRRETYFFHQPAFRQACYKLLLYSQRARLHFAIAEILDKDAKDDAETAGLVAYHYSKALELSGGVKAPNDKAPFMRASTVPTPNGGSKVEEPVKEKLEAQEASKVEEMTLQMPERLKAQKYLKRRSFAVQSKQNGGLL